MLKLIARTVVVATSGIAAADPHSCAEPDRFLVRHIALDPTPDFASRRPSGAAELTVEQLDPYVDAFVLDTRDLGIRSLQLMEPDGRTRVLAYPHGTEKPQAVREGSVILVDVGCKVHGYTSDISRTWVFGEPGARQREVWDTVRRGQEIALETAQIGLPVGDIDHAVRAYYESLGWARDYGLPGTSHRTGHGIGMDGHEPPNLMRADRTPLAKSIDDPI